MADSAETTRGIGHFNIATFDRSSGKNIFCQKLY